MKKQFCDKCSAEITKENCYSWNGLPFTVADHEFSIKPPEATDIDFDICKYCLIDAVAKLDDRPNPTPAFIVAPN